MKISDNSALLVIDIQQEDFKEMNESNFNDARWECIRNAKRVLDVFRKKGAAGYSGQRGAQGRYGRFRA